MHSKRKAETKVLIPAKRSRVEEVLPKGKNSLMQLNELGINGLKWDIEQMSNVFPQRFRATCIFTQPFNGFNQYIKSSTSFCAEGINKSICRHDIADQIMSCLSGKKLNVLQPSGTILSPVKDVLTKTIHKSDNEAIPIEDAVRILNEKVPDIEYNYNVIENGFCCFVSFRGFMTKGIGANKKVSKRNVAVQILRKHFRYLFPEDDAQSQPSVDSITTMDIDKLPLNRRKNFSNKIQEMVKTEFDNLVSSLDIQYSKRKVLAGIVLSRKLKIVFPNYYRQQDESLTPNIIDPMQFFLKTGWTVNPDDCGEILKLVTVSSGTKCLSGNEINSSGDTVNDCHAEVVSKRALQYFLYRTMQRLTSDKTQHNQNDKFYGTDILERCDQWTYKVKDDVKFHLYVSSSPCGDSRIFLPQAVNNDESEEEADEDSHPNRKNRGILRTKIECGEGTIPIKTKHIQTWDGILGGERLLTMSCSDKVCVWNVLGLQGALLSNVLSEPIYLDSITIGSLFRLDHSQRALYERAKGVTGERDWLLNLANSNNGIVCDQESRDDLESSELEISSDNVDSFQVNAPCILTVTEQDEKCPGKASNFSANWIVGENNNLEIIATNKGLRIDNEPSRLSKRSLFRAFLDVFKWSRVICPGDRLVSYNDMKSLARYPDNAIGAINYQRKKIALYKFFDQQNFGRWIGKPSEQDWFGLKIQN